MINFYYTTDKTVVSKVLSEKLALHLARGKVLWLVAGGSSISIAVEAANRLADSGDLSNLTVSLTDERFGSVDHVDSNWKQLMEAGFALNGAQLLPVLKSLSLVETVASYTKLLEGAMAESSYTVALAGIGADGHIFGIKPNSPAVDSQQTVVGYEWQDYIRITPTIKFIKRLDEFIIYAVGAEKHAQLDRIEQEVSVREQPAQLLKAAKQVSIYNDYKGEKL